MGETVKTVRMEPVVGEEVLMSCHNERTQYNHLISDSRLRLSLSRVKALLKRNKKKDLVRVGFELKLKLAKMQSKDLLRVGIELARVQKGPPHSHLHSLTLPERG
jgi:hypothetical protein